MSSIDRKPHRIKPERSMEMPRHLLFFDAETSMTTLPGGDVEHRLKLAWACYWRRGDEDRKDQELWHEFRDHVSFWDFVFGHVPVKGRLWCIARNINFDFTVLDGFRYLEKAGYHVKFFYAKGSVTIISVTKQGSSLVFLDSMNWFVESLEKTGRRIGIPKMHVDFDTCSISELSSYCKNDVRIELENFRIFIRFLLDNNISRLCMTQGSTAMAAYLNHHYKHDIWIHNNREAIDLERAAYFGGRVEAFHIGKLTAGPYYVVDVNSLYPFVMRKYDYPCRYLYKDVAPTIPQMRDLIRTHAVVANVVVQTTIPIFPVKGTRTIFPVGTYSTSLCTPEIDCALRKGFIKHIGNVVVYEKAALFRSYVDTMYALRLRYKQEHNDAYIELCKKLMNTLYGKFGQKAERWVKIADAPDESDRVDILVDHDTGQRSTLRYLMGEVFELCGCGEAFDSFPAIAAHVTAYGRMWLWHLMEIVGKGHYFYCDTDSLMVDSLGYRRLKDEMNETELGKLKLVETTQTLDIRGAKDYKTDMKSAIKGISKAAKEVQDGVFVQDQWPSISGRLRRGDKGVYRVKKVTKHLRRDYQKGTVLSTGSVLPLVLDLDGRIKQRGK